MTPGFVRASVYGIRPSFEVPDEAMMALVLGGQAGSCRAGSGHALAGSRAARRASTPMARTAQPPVTGK